MDPSTIKEARRILKAIVENGTAMLKSGRIVSPDDGMLLSLVEKVASKKLEEPEKVVEVTDFVPTGTYHTKPKPDLVDRSNQP